jgi:hypothetical protein
MPVSANPKSNAANAIAATFRIQVAERIGVSPRPHYANRNILRLYSRFSILQHIRALRSPPIRGRYKAKETRHALPD